MRATTKPPQARAEEERAVDVLPLEQEKHTLGILTFGIEFHRTLQAIERIRAQFLDELDIIDTLNLVDGLLQHLCSGVPLNSTRVNVLVSATKLSKVVLDELSVLIGVEPRIPPCLRGHYTLGSSDSDSIGKRFPLVRTRRSNKRLRIVVLLLKGFDEGDRICHANRTKNNHIRSRMNYLFG